MTTTGRRRFFTPLRSLVIASCLLAAAISYPAAAQTTDTTEVEKTAYWTSPVTDALPPTAVDGFPPGVVCIVVGIAQVPQLCGEEVQELKAQLGLTSGLPIPDSPESNPDFPQPVAPNTLPVGLIGGQERYSSFLKFKLPQVPFGETVDRFVLELDQADAPNYALESPAMRQASKAALAQISGGNPDPFVELFEAIVNDPTVTAQTNPTGIEACPVLEDWEAGSHDAANEAKPEVDCIFGSNGRFDDDTNTWTWDLTFAMQGWVDGTFPNHGIILRPLGAENLAYGDPDLSTNWMVSLSLASGDEPEYTLTSSPAPEPFVPSDSGPSGFPARPAAPVQSSDPFVSAAPTPPPEPSPAPAQPAPAPQIAVQNAVSGEAEFPWWIWLLVPLALYGHYMLGTAAMATPSTVSSRPGALSALMERSGEST